MIVWKLELVSAFLHPAQPRHHLLTSQKGQATSLISYRRVISDITGVLPSFIHSSTLAWQLLWMEEPGGLQSMGSLRVGHDWATSLSLFTFMHWRRKWQPTPVFLPGESPGMGEPGWLRSMRLHRVGHDWGDLAAAAAATIVWDFLT